MKACIATLAINAAVLLDRGEWKQQLDKCVETGEMAMGERSSRAGQGPEFRGVFL